MNDEEYLAFLKRCDPELTAAVNARLMLSAPEPQREQPVVRSDPKPKEKAAPPSEEFSEWLEKNQ